MSTAVAEEVLEFHRFLSEEIAKQPEWKTPEQAVAFWRQQRPVPPELAESVAAIRESLDAMYAGDRGRPAAEVIADARKQLALASRP